MNISKSKKVVVFFGVVAVFVLVLGFKMFVLPEINTAQKPWSVVYLATGEIYIGKVSHFPRFRITGETYILQVVQSPAEEEGMEPQASFQLMPIKDVLWAPEKLYLNREQVVFYGPVLETSRVGEAIKEAGKW